MPRIFSRKIANVFALRHVGGYLQINVKKLGDRYLKILVSQFHLTKINIFIKQMKGEENIYEGLFTKRVNLAIVKPEKIIKADDVYLEIHNDSKINALKYRYPLNYLGPQYKGIVVPCTPAFEISAAKLRSLSQMGNQQINNLKFFAKVPSQSVEVQNFGIASGKRSSIYKNSNGKLLRFKGCGNEQKGFNKQKDQSRGHHFYHTAKRQLYITKQINKIMQTNLGISPPANQPLYAFDYPEKQISELKLANDLPMISKYCCVFQTQGDRRAGTHLISPLEILFLSIVNHESVGWKQKFQQKSRIDNGELVELVTNFQLFVEPGNKFLPTYDSSKQITNYLTLEEVRINLVQNYSEVITDITTKLVPEIYRQYVLGLLKNVKPEKIIEVSQTIIERIGFQMGQIKRVMCQHEISWGFYLDHGFQWHCNAHLNNFIVTQPKCNKQSSNFFLLPLDYDLAYSSKEFICIDIDSDSYGKNSDQIFQNYLCGQFSAMEMSLFGLQVMNFKYGIEKEQTISQDKKMSKIAFRDTLVKAFNAGMRNKINLKQKILEKWDRNIQEIQKLVEACLYFSMDFQT